MDKSLLDGFGEVWEDTVPEAWEGTDVPDGKYTVQVSTCVLKETQKTGKPMIAWDLVIQTRGFEGRHLFLNRVLDRERPDSIKYARGDFQKIGIEVATPREFVNACEAALDKVIEVQVKTNGDYTNIYINKLAAGATASASSKSNSSGSGVNPAEKLPF